MIAFSAKGTERKRKRDLDFLFWSFFFRNFPYQWQMAFYGIIKNHFGFFYSIHIAYIWLLKNMVCAALFSINNNSNNMHYSAEVWENIHWFLNTFVWEKFTCKGDITQIRFFSFPPLPFSFPPLPFSSLPLFPSLCLVSFERDYLALYFSSSCPNSV